ncbi:MAG TPA: sigma-70 family RNA polymerase sigma factor [Bacteroidetes bacterium]|nr:sigma-70 family RNA polymerase sigma factor [Bacteroidota bacterium]HIL58251.1 sigma-70 family RNA polymerase sigma factor [Rhodothermales bacterium]
MPSADVTALLADLRSGDSDAVDAILPHVYGELQDLARRQLRGERDGHTLNTTALVHEAYLKLVRQDRADWQSRAHFLGVAALAMRRILINYAKKRKAEKRGGGAVLATFEEGAVGRVARTDELLALDEALDRLAERSERQARVVELSFFGGLTQPEIAEALGVSEITVRRDWRMARAWLSHELREAPD